MSTTAAGPSLSHPQASALLTSFTDFLTIALHSLLYYRNLYPPPPSSPLAPTTSPSTSPVTPSCAPGSATPSPPPPPSCTSAPCAASSSSPTACRPTAP
ncbi:hypothetical protein PT974_12136 [Cladobotryum mycophilum]|uniref:Uncharacterized protein n=1 Tax=Cladobotryum mycophilum TaxID=491253 RepID=A0ABR0S768_9HYPO